MHKIGMHTRYSLVLPHHICFVSYGLQIGNYARKINFANFLIFENRKLYIFKLSFNMHGTRKFRMRVFIISKFIIKEKCIYLV
jgi:hypothetical protein